MSRARASLRIVGDILALVVDGLRVRFARRWNRTREGIQFRRVSPATSEHPSGEKQAEKSQE